jgi:valine dehydrogenase (NAD+)
MTVAVERPAPSPISPPDGDGLHEQVVIHQDPTTGMRLIVAVHSTVLGPALGGMRLSRYPGGLRQALDDVLGLARTMTLKASATGLDLGGGKAVMIDDGRAELRAARFQAAAEVIQSLGGSYITAEDIGTTTDDMDLMSERTRFVVGRSVARGGAGDPSPTTATTVRRAIARALAASTGSATLEGRRIGLIGVGKVGGVLAAGLAAEGADVVAADLDAERLDRIADAHGVRTAPSTSAILGMELDVLAPCAGGGLIDARAATRLDCRVVCGAANNPLADDDADRALAARGILYVPDFLANCGGLIHVAAEWRGYDERLVRAGIERAMERLDEALAGAASGSETPLDAATRHALDRVRRGREAAAAGALAA